MISNDSPVRIKKEPFFEKLPKPIRRNGVVIAIIARVEHEVFLDETGEYLAQRTVTPLYGLTTKAEVLAYIEADKTAHQVHADEQIAKLEEKRIAIEGDLD